MSKSSRVNSTAADPFLSPAPHIHSGAAIAVLHWKKTAALLPLFGVCLWQFRADLLSVFFFSLLAGLAGEFLFEILSKKKIRLADGSSVLNSLLFSFMLPPGIPLWMAAAGALFGSVAGREIFGGLGTHPFHPALAGRLFLGACFPLFFENYAPLFQNTPLEFFAAAAGALFLWSQKLISWESPLICLGVILISLLPFGLAASVFSTVFFFGAFFLLTEPVSAPLSRTGLRIYAAAAGVLTVLLAQAGVSFSFFYALFFASCLSPWLDRLFRQGSAL